MTVNEPDLRPCDKCGTCFSPRTRSGGSPQRFCTSGCRLDFHTERLRRQRKAPYAGQSLLAATPHATANAGLRGLQTGFVLMTQQDFIEVGRDEAGNLLLRQRSDLRGEHELQINRDYFPQFLQMIETLHKLIADAIREEQAP
jgi:hypothetical protein